MNQKIAYLSVGFNDQDTFAPLFHVLIIARSGVFVTGGCFPLNLTSGGFFLAIVLNTCISFSITTNHQSSLSILEFYKSRVKPLDFSLEIRIQC